MIKNIYEQYLEETGKKNLFKAIFRFYENNNFRCLCSIRFVLNTKNEFLRHIRRNRLERQFKFSLGENAKIGKGFHINHFQGIVIGDGVIIGERCNIFQGVTLGQKNGVYPIIKNDVTLFPGCMVIGEVTIGNHAIIAPNSVVISDVPDNAVYSGIPAVRIK